MTEKWVVVIYVPMEELEYDTVQEAYAETDKQDRLYGHICRVRVEECDNEGYNDNVYMGD